MPRDRENALMTNATIAGRTRQYRQGTPERYLDAYDEQADFGNIHPTVRNQMDPIMDTLDKSQQMRGVRDKPRLGDDDMIWEQILGEAARTGWTPKGPGKLSKLDMYRALKAAEPAFQGDSGLVKLDMAYKSLGVNKYPLGNESPWPATPAIQEYSPVAGRARALLTPEMARVPSRAEIQADREGDPIPYVDPYDRPPPRPRY